MGRMNMWLNGSNYGANLPVWKAWTVRKGLLLGAIVVMLAAAGGVVYALSPHSTPRIKVTCIGELPDDYDVMDERQIICRYQKQTGKDIRDVLDKRHYSASDFKSFKEAYDTAKALHGMVRTHPEAKAKSLAVYGVAEAKASGIAEANWEFYLNYSKVALENKQENLYKKLQDKYKAAIKNDQTLDANSKKDMLDQAAQAERRRKLGY